MTTNRFDTKLLAYQALLSVPTQVLILDIYDKIEVKDANTYMMMSLLNLGAALGTAAVAKSIYSRIHKDAKYDNTDFHLSPLSQYIYSRHRADIQEQALFNQGAQNAKLDEMVEREPAYSTGYMQAVYSTYGAKAAYATLNSPLANPFAKLLYGLSQPLSIVLRDSGKLR